MTTHRIVSNLFSRDGWLDPDGDEDEVNVAAITYRSRAKAVEQVEHLAARYPNAFVDLE